jgi:non-heme chloroperoxidase
MADSRTPVIFVHGLWLHASSWNEWVELFRAAGYEPIAPGWPGDAPTVSETREHPEQIANHGINEVTEHYANIIRSMGIKPIVIGHSFGGLVAEKLLGQDLAAAAVAIDPAQPKGVVRLPMAQLRSAFPILRHPSQFIGSNMLSRDQFKNNFANEISEEEANDLYDRYIIPAPGRPLFQAAFANLAPHAEAKVELDADRGPLLIIGSEKDQTVPEVTTHDTYDLYKKRSHTVNDYKVFEDRGHSLVIDHGWPDVANFTLAWLDSTSKIRV